MPLLRAEGRAGRRVHRSEVLANHSRPLLALRELLQGGGLAVLLGGIVRPHASVPGRHRRLDEAAVTALIGDYAAGKSVYALAREYRIDRGVVAQHLKDRGIPMRPTLLQSEIDRAVELSAAGLTANKIGRLLGRDPKTIRRVLASESG